MPNHNPSLIGIRPTPSPASPRQGRARSADQLWATTALKFICLGGNVFGWTVSRSPFGLLGSITGVSSSLHFIDTADVYSRWAPGHQGGESETILGKWFARSGRRNSVILATKVGMEMGEGTRASALFAAGGRRRCASPHRDRLHRPLPGPQNVLRLLEGSLAPSTNRQSWKGSPHRRSPTIPARASPPPLKPAAKNNLWPSTSLLQPHTTTWSSGRTGEVRSA